VSKEAEEDAESVLGATITSFGFDNGVIVLGLDDDRQLRFGSDIGNIWFFLQEYTVH
jgi:hypothetical protein